MKKITILLASILFLASCDKSKTKVNTPPVVKWQNTATDNYATNMQDYEGELYCLFNGVKHHSSFCKANSQTSYAFAHDSIGYLNCHVDTILGGKTYAFKTAGNNQLDTLGTWVVTMVTATKISFTGTFKQNIGQTPREGTHVFVANNINRY